MTCGPGTFCWFECGTTDVAAAKRFYTRLFGWKAVDVPMPGDAGGQYTLLQSGGADVAGLYELKGPMFEGVPPHWMTYVHVEDADAAAAQAESSGATILTAPMDVPGVGRMAFLQDPTGAAFAMFQPGEHAGTDPQASNLGWCELHTPDPATARTFYTDLFGWTAKDDPTGEYTEFQVDGRSIGGMMELRGPGAPPHWLPYALVEDCDASLAQAVDMGAKSLVPAQDVPGVGRFAVITDPTGAAIAIITLTAQG